jgi:hypothetical protein
MILLRLQVIKLFLCISTAPAALDRYLAALPAMSLIPFAPLKLVRYPHSLAPTLVTLPSMSLIPFAPFPYSYQPNATRPSEITLYKSYSNLFSAVTRRLYAMGTTVAASTTGVSTLSVISLRRNGISTTSTTPTARLPAPSSANSFAYRGWWQSPWCQSARESCPKSHRQTATRGRSRASSCPSSPLDIASA